MRSGSGSFTRLRILMILALRVAPSSLVWVRSTSSICSPQVMTGLSAVIGSWKIIDMRVQRSSRSRSSLAASTFSPSSRISPPWGFSALASRPITVKAITDLPEPDSPTRQTISPGLTVKLTFSTALARSAPAGSATVRLRTSRTGFLSAIENDLRRPRPEPEGRSGGTLSQQEVCSEWRGGPRLRFASLGATVGAHTFLLIFGSSVSRRPSPMMLIASTVKARKMPG